MNNEKTEYKIPEAYPGLHRGPAWLKEKRRLLRDSFNSSPLPRRGLHLWRYTDPGEFIFEQALASDTAFEENYDHVEKLELKHLEDGSLAAVATDHGGREIACYLSDEAKKHGLIIEPLSEAVENHFELVEKHLYRLINNNSGKFESLNGALWNDGVFVYIPDNKAIDKPLHVIHQAGRAKSSNFHRLLVVAGRNSDVTIIDEYAGGANDEDGDSSYVNSAVEIIGEDESRVRYISLQRQGRATNGYLTHRSLIGRNAHMLTIPLVFGGALSKQNFGTVLDGPGAQSDMYGLLFGTGYQQFDNHTLQQHNVGPTLSNIDFKVVLKDKSRSAYTGLIRIENDAKTCEAYQENRNLLLNNGTKAESIPELEILNEDVQCTHGATVGPIDPLMIFYLKCRGIEHEEAVRMIVSGFVSKTLKLVPEDIRERLKEVVMERLEDI